MLGVCVLFNGKPVTSSFKFDMPEQLQEVYLHEYATPREARQGLTRYFEFYDQVRSHQALDYRTPAQVYYGKEA